MWTYIIGSFVILYFIYACYKSYQIKKNGTGCMGECEHCKMKDKCHKK